MSQRRHISGKDDATKRNLEAAKRNVPKKVKILPPDRAQWSFGGLVYWHFFKRGTHPEVEPDDPIGQLWSPIEAMDAIGISPRGFWNWVDDKHLPLDTVALERVLFGKSTKFNAERLELQDKLEVTRAKKAAQAALRTKSASRNPPPGLPVPLGGYGDMAADDDDDDADSESNGNDIVVWQTFDEKPFGPDDGDEDRPRKAKKLVPLEPFRAYRTGRRHVAPPPRRRRQVLAVLGLALLVVLFAWTRRQSPPDHPENSQTARNIPVPQPLTDSGSPKPPSQQEPAKNKGLAQTGKTDLPVAETPVQTDSDQQAEIKRLNAERDRIVSKRAREIEEAAKAERERLVAAEKAAEAERAAKAERDRVAAEKAAEIERAAKAERDRIAAEKAAEIERAAKAERDRVAAEKAAEIERAAKPGRDRIAAENAAAAERAAKVERDRNAALNKPESDPAPSPPTASPLPTNQTPQKTIEQKIEEARQAALVKEAREAVLADQQRRARQIEHDDAQQRAEKDTREIAAMGFSLMKKTSMTGESIGLVYAHSTVECALKCLEDNKCGAYAFNDQGKAALPDGKFYGCYRFKVGTPFANEYYTSGQRRALPIARSRVSEATAINPLVSSTRTSDLRVLSLSSVPSDGWDCGSTKVVAGGFRLDCDVRLTGGDKVGVQALKQPAVSAPDCASKCQPFMACAGFTYDSALQPDGRHYCQIFGGTPDKQSPAKGWVSGWR